MSNSRIKHNRKLCKSQSWCINFFWALIRPYFLEDQITVCSSGRTCTQGLKSMGRLLQSTKYHSGQSLVDKTSIYFSCMRHDIYLGVPWGAPGSKLVVVSSIMGCWEFLLPEIWNPELSPRNPESHYWLKARIKILLTSLEFRIKILSLITSHRVLKWWCHQS